MEAMLRSLEERKKNKFDDGFEGKKGSGTRDQE